MFAVATSVGGIIIKCVYEASVAWKCSDIIVHVFLSRAASVCVFVTSLVVIGKRGCGFNLVEVFS